MDWNQIITTVAAIILPMGGAFAWMWSRIDKKFDAVLLEIKEIRCDLHKIDTRLSRLETQDEERFRNEIKLLISKKEAVL